MACPFFRPAARLEVDLWPHRQRLPLGDGFCGTCQAPGHQGQEPAEQQLKDFCNLGYARQCSWLPQERVADAVRFAVARDFGSSITLHYVLERDHAPVEHGKLEYQVASATWSCGHAEETIQAMADAYMRAYLTRRTARRAAAAT